MLQNLTGWHALIILAIVVLVFGAAKLPALAKSVGQSMRILKSEVAETSSEARVERVPSVGDPADARDSAEGMRPALRAAE
ncbi:twin-arginine translocase TatA/TatE family subunit [Microbacterium sp. WCS2018Hpa-9]|uniref:twin-arginine translocase TatA/TatE family subunit n=1 Tax=Microbacterium sp. WCS2018Hpa-9 TaxID=3073635 RepID=UPI0028894BED|nr:twin-arginine translocase TatA/TatE family subunit [Microbacterium sp. WCS2018Hpa-9]